MVNFGSRYAAVDFVGVGVIIWVFVDGVGNICKEGVFYFEVGLAIESFRFHKAFVLRV
jgi:hypothetical protein